jgi:hypothetical protein
VADTSSVVSLVGAGIAAASAVVSAVIGRRTVMRDRRMAADETAVHYRVPLLHAAFNLQTRLWNIGGGDFLGTFLTRGSKAEAAYARCNTVYLIGGYLCWSEILRREAQLLDPLDRRRDRDIMIAMENIRDIMANSRTYRDPVLRVFRGDQRAIGEVLLTTTQSPSGRTGPRWDCIGYAAFVKALGDNEDIARWFETLLSDVDELAAHRADHLARLTALQHALVELINLLDPAGDQVTLELRAPL